MLPLLVQSNGEVNVNWLPCVTVGLLILTMVYKSALFICITPTAIQSYGCWLYVLNDVGECLRNERQNQDRTGFDRVSWSLYTKLSVLLLFSCVCVKGGVYD